MWKKWDESPVFMSLDSNRYPLKNIPFPAVTICNVNKVSKEKLSKVLQEPRYANISYDVMQNTLRYMTKLDRAINNKVNLEQLKQFYESANISAKDFFQILKNTTQTCDDLVADCIWLGLPSPCMRYFTLLPTDDGICCTFNGAAYSDPQLGIEYSPVDVLRVGGNGYRMGLALVMDAKLSDYSVTNGKFDGFKVLVHSPDEFPDVNDRGFVIGPGSEIFVAVKGITTFNTEEVAKVVKPDKRQCQMEEEHKLLFFPRYSRAACTIECDTKLVNDTCNCRPYFFRADNGTQLYELDSYSCISDVYENVRNNGDELCYECLPPCTDILNEPEISYAPFPGRGLNLSHTYRRLVNDLNVPSGTDGNEYLETSVAIEPEIAREFAQMGNYDSCLYFYQLVLKETEHLLQKIRHELNQVRRTKFEPPKQPLRHLPGTGKSSPKTVSGIQIEIESEESQNEEEEFVGSENDNDDTEKLLKQSIVLPMVGGKISRLFCRRKL